VSGDKPTDDDDDNQLVVAFDSADQEAQKLYIYLWVSEKYFLQGICQFLELASKSSQRSQLDVST